MLTKCICTNCAGHLEFEEENAGETIACPHCGFKTVLKLPGTEVPDPDQLAWLRKRLMLWRLRKLGAVVLVLVALGYVAYRWGVPWVQDLTPAIDTTAKALVVLLVGCALLPLVLAWLLFPVLLFFQLRRLNQLLERVVQNVGASETTESEPEPESESEPEAQAEESLASEADAEPDRGS